jgi:hypothetical protein
VDQIQAQTPCFFQNYGANTCTPNRNGPHCPIEFRAERLGLAASRVGLTAFLQISNQPAVLARGLLSTSSEGRVLWRKEP